MNERVPGLRWSIALLLGAGVVISYFDRVNASVAEEPMRMAFGLDHTQMGILQSSYLWSYTLLQLPVGAALDRYGVKWLLRVGIVVWAFSTFLTASATGMGMLIGSRILLGIAESPAFPGSAKAVGNWFPRHERGLATSAFDAAAKFSNVIGIPLMAWAVGHWTWRGAFWLTGALTLLFAVAFWLVYRDPDEHPWLSAREKTYIASGGAQMEAAVSDPWTTVKYLLRQRKVWGLALGFAAYGYAFYFLITWLPGILQEEMHFDFHSGSMMLAAIPWLVATITDVAIGGWLVDHLIERGHDGTRVRKGFFILGLALGLAILGAAFTRSPVWVLCWLSISLGGLAFAAPIGWSIPGLIAPRGATASVGAIMNLANNLLGIAAPIVTGYVRQRTGNFASAFLLAGVILAIGIVAFTTLLGRIEPIPEPEAA
ncbi:MAG: MFS transporter [Candidatus Xenobia bacterium]